MRKQKTARADVLRSERRACIEGGDPVERRAWIDPPIPEDPAERRRVGIGLVVLALLLPAARLLSRLFR